MSLNFSALTKRLFSRFTCNPVAAVRPANRFRPALESLDARDVPAALTWTNAAANNDFYTPGNWNLTGTSTVSPSAPVMGDDVTFDGNVSSDDCDNLGLLSANTGDGGSLGGDGESGGEGGGEGPTGLHSLKLINGYAGTVTIVAALEVGTLNLLAPYSALSQPSGYSDNDITVTSAFTWTGGTLNSSNHLANVTITGSEATALIQPTSGGTVYLGSTFNLSSGAVATLKEGTIEAINSGIEFNINANCGMRADPGATRTATVGVDEKQVQLNIKSESWFQVLSGNYVQKGGAKITGGSLILEDATTASFGPRIDVRNIGGAVAFVPWSVYQTSGATYLAASASLIVQGSTDDGGGMLMTDGLLSIKSGTIPSGFLGHLVGDLSVSGGDIRFESMASGDSHAFATFYVNGNVNWVGGTYHPYVSSESATTSDTWYVEGTFSISGTAAVDVTAVDGENVTLQRSELGFRFFAGWRESCV